MNRYEERSGKISLCLKVSNFFCQINLKNKLLSIKTREMAEGS
jgi:hypothetical protein